MLWYFNKNRWISSAQCELQETGKTMLISHLIGKLNIVQGQCRSCLLHFTWKNVLCNSATEPIFFPSNFTNWRPLEWNSCCMLILIFFGRQSRWISFPSSLHHWRWRPLVFMLRSTVRARFPCCRPGGYTVVHNASHPVFPCIMQTKWGSKRWNTENKSRVEGP